MTLALTSSLNLGALSSQLGLLLLLLFLCTSSTLLFLSLLELALLHLLFQGLESSLRSLAFLGQLVFLLALFLPDKIVSDRSRLCAFIDLLHALSLRFLSLLLLSQRLLSDLILRPLSLGLGLLYVVLCDICLILA